MSPQPLPPYPILYIRDDQNATAANSTTTPTPSPKPEEHKAPGFPGFLIAVIVIGVLAGLGFIALIVYKRRASHQRAFGSAPGAPSLDGAKASLSNLWYKISNPRDRSTSAGFEGISAGRAQHRGRALDPDEAWDSRVGHEADAYYEDTELQGTTSYHGVGGTAYLGAAGAGRGNHSGMPSENPFGDEHSTSKVTQNPFGDEHADHSNIRSVSPRPMVDTGVAGHEGNPAQTSPTRRSLFKENM